MTITGGNIASMTPLTTSTLILARLFARFEGQGKFMASVPRNMKDLAERLCRDQDVPGQEAIVASKGGRWVFCVRDDAKAAMTDLGTIPGLLLMQDQVGLREMMTRIGVMEAETNVLEIEELTHLGVHIKDDTGWLSKIAVKGDGAI